MAIDASLAKLDKVRELPNKLSAQELKAHYRQAKKDGGTGRPREVLFQVQPFS